MSVVTPCITLNAIFGSVSTAMSSWLWTSMKPGVTAKPVASSSTPARSGTVPTSTMRSPRTATSARAPGAPLPSYTVPPRITRSNAPDMLAAPARRSACDVSLEVADAVGDDAGELIPRVAGDAERGRQPEDRAPCAEDRASLPRLPVQVRHALGVEGPPGAIRLHEVHADHHAPPSHLAYDRPLAEGCLEPFEQASPHLLRV